MNIEYKGYRITAWAERDDTTGLWNGRYRILDQKGTVAYESFAEPPTMKTRRTRRRVQRPAPG